MIFFVKLLVLSEIFKKYTPEEKRLKSISVAKSKLPLNITSHCISESINLEFGLAEFINTLFDVGFG